MPRGEIDDPGGLPGGQPESRRGPGDPLAGLFHGACRKPVVRQVNDPGIASSRFAAAGVAAYAARQGVDIPAFLDGRGPALTPEQVRAARRPRRQLT